MHRRLLSALANICSVCSIGDPRGMSDPRALLVSVKPHYAGLLLTGAKTVELRRVRPKVGAGCLVLLYASSPTMEMVGTARISSVHSDNLDAIWRLHADQTGVDRSTYDAYFDGRDVAVAITLTDVRPLSRGVPLAELRRRISGFRPPQSFRYMPQSQAAVVV